ncbi:MAG: nitrilase-related carbon-nitrogen hydrolase, partial [bacterium]|nr:nitrilase-related carbon-nitrogen hydrolase [bacterium]
MKIALAQINTIIGDFEGNAEKVLAFSKKAEQQGADLVVFPELTLTGYSPRDLVEIRSFIDKGEKTLDRLAKKVPPSLGVLLGLVTHNKTPGAKPLFNSAVLLHEGKIKF